MGNARDLLVAVNTAVALPIDWPYLCDSDNCKSGAAMLVTVDRVEASMCKVCYRAFRADLDAEAEVVILTGLGK